MVFRYWYELWNEGGKKEAWRLVRIAKGGEHWRFGFAESKGSGVPPAIRWREATFRG